MHDRNDIKAKAIKDLIQRLGNMDIEDLKKSMMPEDESVSVIGVKAGKMSQPPMIEIEDDEQEEEMPGMDKKQPMEMGVEKPNLDEMSPEDLKKLIEMYKNKLG